MSKIFALKVHTGESAEKEFELNQPEITIGREPNNYIVFNDAEVSRRHARILIRDGVAEIEDLSSTNGTTVNGKIIKAVTPLETNDRIIFGEKVIVEFIEQEIADNSAVEPDTDRSKKEKNVIIEQPGLENKAFKEEKDIDKPKLISSEPKTINPEEPAPFGIEVLRKIPNWVLITLIALIFLTLFCIIPLLIIEVTNQWCTLFSGFFNSISPGICM